MRLEDWEWAAPAQLQYWPTHVHPAGPGAWDEPRRFLNLREAVRTAAMERAPPAQVAWIMTSAGRILEPKDVESLWLDMQRFVDPP